MTWTPRLHQIVPVFDMLRIAFADQKDDRRRVRRAVIGQTLLPVGGEKPAVGGNGIDVVSQRQGHDVGFQTIDHRTRLLAGRAMRLIEIYGLAGLFFPDLAEFLIEFLVELPRRIIRHVEE